MPGSIRNKRFPIHWHILAGAAFLVIPVLLSPRPAEVELMSKTTFRDLLADCFMLLFFYINYYQFIPKLYFTKKHFVYGIVLVLGLVIISVIPSLLTDSIEVQSAANKTMRLRDDTTFFMQMQHNLFLYVVVILFSVLLRIRTRLFETEVLKQHAEIGSLKSRINPHFLFNTLNNIYALAIREKAQATANALLKLSGMMRYVVTETVEEFVPLTKEINYTNDYIELQKMRLTKAVELSYEVSGNPDGKRIAPVILMPFIENAFKHGVNPDQHSSIRIKIIIQENSLELTVENQKVTPNNDPHVKSGVGIENTRERLNLVYPKKYNLMIEENSTQYKVRLTLQLI